MTRSRGARATVASPWETVIKVGGSLGRNAALPPFLRRLGELARGRRVLIVPGGGRFADLVRQEMTRLRLAEEAAHRMALRAMDQYGLLLAALTPGARAVSGLREAARMARAGRIPVLLGSSLIDRARGLQRSFDLTSDSIAAYVARRLGARSLVLVKSVERPDGRLRGRAALLRLARRGVVDPLFPRLVPRGCVLWIINGRRRGAGLERLWPQPAARQAAAAKSGSKCQGGGTGGPRASRKAARRSGSRRPSRPPRHNAPRTPIRSG
jgi:5-(aminomethyl)-3-furanmethanol phosphate kinase